MAYRISLHILAMVWHSLLLILAFSLRKSHRHYSALIPVCLFSIGFTSAWALGLFFKSTVLMRLTWVGAFWPASLLLFIRDMFSLPTPRWMKKVIWGAAFFMFIGGLTPACLIRIESFDPVTVAQYGWLEPLLRVVMIFQISAILWVTLSQFVRRAMEDKDVSILALIGFTFYGVGALFTCSLLPLFGEYRYLESTSYGSVIWTSFAVWYVFHELHEKNKSLMELDSMKKDLINHVTHEFRTPLSVITTATEVIDASRPEEIQKRKEYTQMIESNTARLSHFVDELLDLATIQQARVKLEKEEIDIFNLLEKNVAQLKPLASKQKVQINLHGKQMITMIDEDKINQVISNLLSNAIKATPNGTIDIFISSNTTEIKVSVVDTGIGIAKEHLKSIFSSFYRVAIKESPHKGSGLGLAVAKGWVEAHEGKIWAESEGEGKGMTISFKLPR